MTRRAVRTDDRGSATLWVTAASALVLLLGMLVVTRTAAILARHRAEAAADLAALAAAQAIGVRATVCQAAAPIARANRARLVACHPVLAADGRSGSVTVTIALAVGLPITGRVTVTSTARAARDPPTAG